MFDSEVVLHLELQTQLKADIHFSEMRSLLSHFHCSRSMAEPLGMHSQAEPGNE
ncbi:MAG: hypothetical protein V7L02_11445 [Nostoc sp.]|uniref:hypothetical protein n=1 Tax=Nostoc sp. TaxID=1180 RepID=UPI002FFABEBA